MSTVDSSSTAPRRRSSARPVEDHRYTLKVPRVDTSVSQWWDAQHDPSASVRALVREEIMRHGFTDTVNRPVGPMPRRGRPPGSGRPDFEAEDQVTGDGQSLAAEPELEAAPGTRHQAQAETQAKAAEPAVQAAEPAEPAEPLTPPMPRIPRVPAVKSEPQGALRVETDARAAEPVETAPPGGAEASGAGPLTMDEIFGHSS